MIRKQCKRWIGVLIAVSMLQIFLFTGCTEQQESSEQMQSILSFYENWKQNYMLQDTYVTDETQYYVWYSGERYTEGATSVPVTVSEAHGYGMLITVCMADYDSQAQEIFDGMVRFYLAHPSSIGPHLISWQQCDNGTALIAGNETAEKSAGASDVGSCAVLPHFLMLRCSGVF